MFVVRMFVPAALGHNTAGRGEKRGDADQ